MKSSRHWPENTADAGDLHSGNDTFLGLNVSLLELTLLKFWHWCDLTPCQVQTRWGFGQPHCVIMLICDDDDNHL